MGSLMYKSVVEQENNNRALYLEERVDKLQDKKRSPALSLLQGKRKI